MIIKKACCVLCLNSTWLHLTPPRTKDDPSDIRTARAQLSSSALSLSLRSAMDARNNKPVLKLKDMEEKHLHNLFLKNMSGLIEEVKNPTPRLNP